MDRLDCDRMFVAVMETGSFAKAALRLRVSSGQASKLISRLEEDLGVQLLNRTTRALSPTEIGQAYFDRMRSIIDDIEALDTAMRVSSTEPTGRLRVTAPGSFGATQLAPALLDFAHRFPRIDFDVSFSDRVVSLVDEGFDAAVRIGLNADTSLIARKLTEARIVVVASHAYLAANPAPSEPADLRDHACIIDTNFKDPVRWRFQQDGAREPITIDVKGRLMMSSAEACLAAARRDLGITRIPSFMAGPDITGGHLVPLLTSFEDKPLGVYVLYPPTRQLAPKVRALVDFLVERFKGEPAWDRGWIARRDA